MKIKFEELWEKVKDVEGHLTSPDQERWLFEMAGKITGDVLEIGSYKGRSTCCLAAGCADDAKVYAIDPFDNYRHNFDEFMSNLKKCNVEKKVIPLVGLSKKFCELDKKFGLLFIDGSHKYEDVLFDFNTFFPMVNSEGIVSFHDVCKTHPGAFRVWHDIAKYKLKDTGNCNCIFYGKKS